MAKTFLQQVADAKTLSNDSSGSAEVLFKSLINLGTKKILGLSDWTFLKGSKTYSSGTSVQDYNPPYNMAKVDYVNYWNKGVWYVLKEVKDGETWTRMNRVSVTGLPTHWYISNRTQRIGLYPIPSDSQGTIKVGFTERIRDYSADDYSTGSVNASSGTTIFNCVGGIWNAKMVGRSLKVSESNTAIDDYWFRITSFGSASQMTVRELTPNAVTEAAYTISEMIPLPDGFEDLPLYYSLSHYYQVKEKPILAREYERMYNDGLSNLFLRDRRSSDKLLEQQKEEEMVIDVNRDPWALEIT